MVYPARGLLRWLLEHTRWAGVALPPFGVWIEPAHIDNAALVRHELRHLEQAKERGTLNWYLTYLWYTVRYGYRNNPLEVDARAAE
jgi:hypothetical protein